MMLPCPPCPNIGMRAVLSEGWHSRHVIIEAIVKAQR